MELANYFNRDDGSLPEIAVQFASGEGVVAGLNLLFANGAQDISAGGARLWLKDSSGSRSFEGPRDAELVTAGVAEPLHLVLANITCAGSTLPDLGVLILSDALILDYRMGPEWEARKIDALLTLLRDLERFGGRVSATEWWGDAIAPLLEKVLNQQDTT
ncbi:hypothetical protein LJR074_002662 [Acidovorax sp. LjRoot74]|uniref:hypothetical protein n=1 Tax=Acidovorax sp. LjRoot74 TaxID=3342337 RepID=UPI003ED0BC0F